MSDEGKVDVEVDVIDGITELAEQVDATPHVGNLDALVWLTALIPKENQ